MITCLKNVEFEEQFGAMHDRIFHRSDTGLIFHRDGIAAGFVNPAWRAVLVHDGPMFSGWDPDDPDEEYDPFWPDEYEILFDVLAESGETSIVVSHTRGLSPLGEGAYVCPPKIDKFTEGHWKCGLHCHWISVFSPTETWGLICDEQNYGLLGGELVIVEKYIQNAGGLETIKERFHTHAMNQEAVDLMARSNIRALYELVGWTDMIEELD